jgi:hypothetical protein
MKLAAMSDAANKPKLVQAIDCPNYRAPAHSNQLRNAIEARVTLRGLPIEVIDNCCSNALFRPSQLG